MPLLGLPLAATARRLLGLEATDIDRMVESRFFDPISGGFPLRYNAFLEVVLHCWTKYVVALIAGVAFAGFLLSFAVAAWGNHNGASCCSSPCRSRYPPAQSARSSS